LTLNAEKSTVSKFSAFLIDFLLNLTVRAWKIT